MAEFSAPFTGSSITTELQWSRMARRWGLDGVHADDTGSTALKVTGSGAATVSVAAGDAFVNGFYYSNDTTKSVSVTANGGGTARVDLVVLRCDQTANSVTAVYKTGGTVAPTLTQVEDGVWEIPLAQCTVAAGSSVVTAGNVVDKRWFTSKGAVVGLSGARRPSVKGLMLVEGSEIYLGDGTNWNWLATAGNRDPDPYTPVWTAGTTAVNWGSGATNLGRYKILGGGLCWVSIHLVPTANPPSYEDPLMVSLPLPATSAMRQHFTWNFGSSNGEGSSGGWAITNPADGTSKIARFRYGVSAGDSSTTVPNAFSVFTGFPFNIRANDVLSVSGIYQLA